MTDFAKQAGLLCAADGSLYTEKSMNLRYARTTGPATHRSEHDLRTETERDRGRVGYSQFLRRLSGVTQVLTPEASAPIRHSRETHSHKVAMVAREIAEHLVRSAGGNETYAATIAAVGGLDISACEAAGLAHDLGHPPFGHAGEVALNHRLTSYGQLHSGFQSSTDGFEGNAQSFRIVNTLDRRVPFNDKGEPGPKGLDLTYVTLGAMLKYPWTRPDESDESRPPKFGTYETEYAIFAAARAAAAPGLHERQQSLEASVMDLADDITYAIHDLEDFFRADLIDFGRVADYLRSAKASMGKADDNEIPNPFVAEAKKLAEDYPDQFDMALYLGAVESILGLVSSNFSARFSGSTAEVAQLRYTLSGEIATLFSAIRLTPIIAGDSSPLVSLKPKEWHRMQCLKLITRAFVVKGSRMGLIERAQFEVISKLFDSLAAWLRSAPRLASLPQPLRDYVLEAERETRALGQSAGFSPLHLRAISDYICSLSDAEALYRANWLAGRDVPGMTLLPSDT